MPIVVLVHSPLVGPFTWALVADVLQKRGIEVAVPVLRNDQNKPATGIPYWKQHTLAVKNALASYPLDKSLILIGHSGAGPLLPALAEGIVQPISAYVFVDAGLPKNNASRLDQFGSPNEAQSFRDNAVNGLLPSWTSDDLAEVISDNMIRQRFVEELRPTPLEVYEEPLPVFAAWPDAPCAYIQFSPVY